MCSIMMLHVRPEKSRRGDGESAAAPQRRQSSDAGQYGDCKQAHMICRQAVTSIVTPADDETAEALLLRGGN